MNVAKEFNQFAEGVLDSLKNVPFKDLNGYEGRVFEWTKGRRKGAVSVGVEIISPEFKRVIIEGLLPGRFFRSHGHSFKRYLRVYESGVRILEYQEEDNML